MPTEVRFSQAFIYEEVLAYNNCPKDDLFSFMIEMAKDSFRLNGALNPQITQMRWMDGAGIFTVELKSYMKKG